MRNYKSERATKLCYLLLVSDRARCFLETRCVALEHLEYCGGPATTRAYESSLSLDRKHHGDARKIRELPSAVHIWFAAVWILAPKDMGGKHLWEGDQKLGCYRSLQVQLPVKAPSVLHGM
jgi:hypothetical protein